MLDLLRVFSKGWLAKILIALLVVSFGVWGISGSLFFGNQTTVVEVGETKVDAVEYRFAYETQMANLSRNFQRRITRQEADALGMRQSVLAQMVAGAVLDENARKMGLGVSDENLARTIADDPTFRDLSGNFSRTALQVALRNAGLSENEYIESRRRVSMRNQILDGTASALDMPAVYIDALSRFQNETRVFDFIALGEEVAADIAEPSGTDVEAFFEDNKSDYMAPEYRKLAILKLEPTDLSKPQDVTEEELTAAYENRKTSLRQPERREIQQLVLDNSAVETVRNQLETGVPFDEIVQQQGKSLEDINLGTLTRQGLPDAAVAEAAFAAELNKPSGIVEGAFGPVVIRVVRIDEESTTPFDEIKDQLRDEIALERAIEDVFSIFNSVEDERGAGETVLATGATLNLATTTIESIDSTGRDKNEKGVAGIPELPKLLAAAFQAQPGDDTQAIEIGENGFMWFDVLEIEPERQKTLDEVRGAVVADWKTAEIDKQIEALAKNIMTRVEAGTDFNMVLAELLPTDSLGQAAKFETTEPLKRSDQSAQFPGVAVQSGFGISDGKTGNVRIGKNRFIVYRVSGSSVAGDTALDSQLENQINDAASQDILGQVVEHLQSRETVLVNQNAVDLALSAGRGQAGY